MNKLSISCLFTVSAFIYMPHYKLRMHSVCVVLSEGVDLVTTVSSVDEVAGGDTCDSFVEVIRRKLTRSKVLLTPSSE